MARRRHDVDPGPAPLIGATAAWLIRRSRLDVVKTLAPRIEEICNDLIDAFADRGECDFVEAFAVQLPVIVIGEQLGVPDEDIHLIKTWSDAFALQLSGQANTEQLVEVARIILAYQKYFAAKLEHRREDRRG